MTEEGGSRTHIKSSLAVNWSPVYQIEMDSPPSSPTSLVVSSPRRTLSLLRERRVFTPDSEVKKSPEAEATLTSTTGFTAEHGPKTSEVYGFVGTITTVITTVIYLVWAYTPEPWLHSLGITYYPSKDSPTLPQQSQVIAVLIRCLALVKYWALAVPTFAMVTVVLVIVFYIGLNFMITPPPTSFNTMFDEYSREPSKFVPVEEEEKPIEPISDINIGHVNDLMFG